MALQPDRVSTRLTSLAAIALAVVVCTFGTAAAEESAGSYTAKEVYRSDDGDASAESLGEGVYLFRWWPGLYVSPFLVGDNEVLVVDPINPKVAALYRDAIRSITDRPITKIVYSHEHLDHIGGAHIIAPDAEIYAHPGVRDFLEERGESDIRLPTKALNDGDRVRAGDRSVIAHYFGPNHGDYNVALRFETGIGSMLALVDTIEIGIAPYRSLPDTHFHGYLKSLKAAAALKPDWVLGGHSGPGPGVWLTNFYDYFVDMREALAAGAKAIDEEPPAPGEDFITASERHIAKVVDYAVDQLRPKYGHWRGFEEWAPMNAQTIRMAISIGK